ncbi:MAG: Coenzyme F420 hydrogenase/dehydrogenase, beta subunit C-terminal domain [Clostridia bacterium]|nr:Coenzyme F420 hydrogenase/dehydrogenase, beta subunit C-terminal domain [Clostridia bacterium]
MKILCAMDICTGCGACAQICPKKCIDMIPDAEGFLRPVIREAECIHCGRCRKVCPLCTPQSKPDTQPVAYAAINTDETTRMNSTSGGVFTLLCQWVLERGGVVFGAAYDVDFRVMHCRVDNLSDLHRLRGAKYAQSRIGETFAEAKQLLRSGRYVLFSGTPCQIGGLRSYLGREEERLILVDLICHGAPSPKVWQHYIDHRCDRDASGQRPEQINLRSKVTGWPRYSIRFEYPDGTVYSAPNGQDPYLKGFIADLYLRPSCYACAFKGMARASDFTLGDYWGVWGQMPEYHDGKGTSLVLLHTGKAKTLWAELSSRMKYGEAPVSAAIGGNPSAVTSAPYNERRAQFFCRYEAEDFEALVEELCPPPVEQKPSLVRRIVRKVRRMLKR